MINTKKKITKKTIKIKDSEIKRLEKKIDHLYKR